MSPVRKNNDIFRWFESVRGIPVPKFITGLRGSGKAEFLTTLRNRLITDGLPPERCLLIDTDDPSLRKYATHEQMIDYILNALPRKGKSYIFIREATALPNPEIVIGTLAASGQHDLLATSSSRRLLNQGLAGYFSTRLAHFEKLPDKDRPPYTSAEAHARWNDIFLNDVLAPGRIVDVAIAKRVAGWLSDNLGTTTSLRNIALAISSSKQLMSPHTVNAYLAALEEAHLVEKVVQWDEVEATTKQRGYRYFYTDPELRLAYFGPAPEDEARRMALNRAWLFLRHEFKKVFTVPDGEEFDFIARRGHSFSHWRAQEDGSVECLDG